MKPPRKIKCPVKKPKQIEIRFESADANNEYYNDLGIEETLFHVQISVSLAVKFSDINELLRKKKLTQKDLKQIISKRI